MTPPVLQSIIAKFGNLDRFRIVGEWSTDAGGRWHLPVVARLSVPPSEHMPSETSWRLVIGPNQPSDGVFYYPDAEDGINITFRHQDLNKLFNDGRPWRSGKPCLERPISGLGRDDWEDEPRDVESAALWKAARLLQWIDAAATGNLSTQGDVNELPAGVGLGSKVIVGFRETMDDLQWANSSVTRWGFAKLTAVPGAKSSMALAELLDERSKPIRAFNWGAIIQESQASLNAMWLLTAGLPVLKPWDAPSTWAELSELLATQDVDLADILVQAGARYRSSSRPTAAHRLMIGFPYASICGADPERIHWLAIANVKLAGRTEKRKGFRPREESRRLWDRQMARSRSSLMWVRTENWAPDQLQSRGGVGQQVAGTKILVIGAGSLGSAVAETLCRSGALHLAIMDGEILHVGNLVRHVLSMADTGHNKAEALAKKLNGLSPNAKTVAIPSDFGVTIDGELADMVRSYDVIVDCTGSDDLLDELAAFSWHDEKLFISLSMTWRAEGLLAFCAKETEFPVIDAKHRFEHAGAPTVQHGEANVEAIGCWNPVFPADADDVQKWSAVGSKFIRAAIAEPTRRFKYFRSTSDGGIVVDDV